MTERLAVTILTILLAAGAFAAGEEDLVTRTFDVSALLDGRVDPPIERIGLGDNVFPDWEEEEPAQVFFLDAVMLEDAVRRFVSPRQWSLDGIGIDWPGETRMEVTATPEMVAAVSGLLDELFRLAARRIEVRAELLAFDAEGVKRLAASGSLSALSSGRLDAAARDVVLAEASRPGCTAEKGTLSIRPGALAALAQTSSVSYVSDMDVEIAQGSVVGDPIVRFVTEGWLLTVRPFLLADGAVWLEALPQHANRPERMRRVNPEASPLGSIDFPVVGTERLFAAGRVAGGETMALLRRTGGGPRSLVALLLTPSVVGAAPEGGRLRFLPTAALTTEGLTASSGWHGVDGGESSYIPAPTRAAFLSAPAMGTGTAPPALEYPGNVRTDAEPDVVECATGLLVASKASAERIRARIRERERSVLASFAVRLVLSDGEGRRIAEVRTEVPADRPAFYENGVTRAFLADWDVEVAQEARVGDPIVGHAFGGLVANLRLARSPDGGKIAGRVAIAFVTLDPEFETLRTGNELTGIIELPRARQTMFEQEVVVAPGEPVEMDGGRHRLELTVTPR